MNWLHQYWPHMTGGVVTIAAIVFKDTLNDIWIGFKNYIGAKWAERFSEKRKHSRRVSDMTIGALTQQVKDQGKTIKYLLAQDKKKGIRLEACQAERTECRADLKNLMIRVSALERR